MDIQNVHVNDLDEINSSLYEVTIALNTENEIEYLFHLRTKYDALKRTQGLDLKADIGATLARLDNQIKVLESRIEASLGLR